MRPLDIEAVRTFVSVADLRSFTRAAEALGTTQGAISVKIKRLEDRIGHRLIERTPRSVRLSAQGAAFLEAARDLLSAHERALASLEDVSRHFSLGIAAHVVGPEMPSVLARLHAHDPNLTIEVQFDTSRKLLDLFETGRIDVAIVEQEDGSREGETLVTDRIGWFAAEAFVHHEGHPLRLAALSSLCGVHNLATELLDAAGIAWSAVFLGGGSAAVHAAVSAGLAMAPISCRIAPTGTIDMGPRLGLPPLPSSTVVLHSSLTDQRTRAALRVLTAAFRDHRQPRISVES